LKIYYINELCKHSQVNLVTILLEGGSVSAHYNVIICYYHISKKQSKLKLTHCTKQQNPSLSHNLTKIKKLTKLKI